MDSIQINIITKRQMSEVFCAIIRAMRIEDFEIKRIGKDTCSVVQYKGEDEHIVIPPVIGKYAPVAIESTLIKKGSRARWISIPGSVEEINEALFPSLRNIEGFDVDKSSRSFSAENGILYDGSRYSLIFYPSTKKDRVFQSPKKLGRVARTAFCCKVHFSEFVYSSKLEEFQVLPSECPELESFVPSDDAADYDGVLIKGKKLLFYPPKAGGKAYSIPDGIEEIASTSAEPFFPPSVKTVYVPASLKKGLENALGNASSVEVDSRSQSYRTINGVLYSWKRVLLSYPGKMEKDVYVTPIGTDRIGEGAFRGAPVHTLVLSNGVTAIGNNAFENSDITTLIIPSSVTDIGVHALFGAKKLKCVIVEKGSVAEIFLRGENRNEIMSVLPTLF